MKSRAITYACLAAIALCALASCAEPPPPPADAGEPPPEVELEGVGLRLFKGETLRSTGTARAATFQRTSGEVTAQRIRLRFHGVQKDGDARLEAGSGRGDIRTQLAELSSGVRLRGADGTRGFTPRAFIDGNTEQATGVEPVEIAGDHVRSRAIYGFTLDFATPGSLSLNGPVTTRLGENP